MHCHRTHIQKNKRKHLAKIFWELCSSSARIQPNLKPNKPPESHRNIVTPSPLPLRPIWAGETSNPSVNAQGLSNNWRRHKSSSFSPVRYSKTRNSFSVAKTKGRRRWVRQRLRHRSRQSCKNRRRWRIQCNSWRLGFGKEDWIDLTSPSFVVMVELP